MDQAGGDFPARFTDFALAAVEVQQSVSGRPPMVCPLNEINFLSWAVEVGYFPSVGSQEHGWFKRQLVRTAIEAAKAVRAQWPDAFISWAEPLVHVAPRSHRRPEVRAAEQYRQGQFEAYDWIIGRAEPELGGDPSLADLIGLNFYPHNQWYLDGPTIPMGHHEYRALSEMLCEVGERYGKPIFISETGAEGAVDRHGSITSAVRFAMRWTAARTSAASAGIRLRPIPAGTILGTPRPDFYRPSLQRAFATWTSHCCGKWRCNVNCSSNGKGGMSTTGKRD